MSSFLERTANRITEKTVAQCGLAAVSLGVCLLVYVEDATPRQIALNLCTFSLQTNIAAALWWVRALALSFREDPLLDGAQGGLVSCLSLVALAWLFLLGGREDGYVEWFRNGLWHYVAPALFLASWVMRPRKWLSPPYYAMYPLLYVCFAYVLGRYLGYGLYSTIDDLEGFAMCAVFVLALVFVTAVMNKNMRLKVSAAPRH